MRRDTDKMKNGFKEGHSADVLVKVCLYSPVAPGSSSLETSPAFPPEGITTYLEITGTFTALTNTYIATLKLSMLNATFNF